MSQLGDLILKFSGLDPRKTGTVVLPKDPYLIVVEYQRVTISRAFGGTARFDRTRAFDRLRRWIQRNGNRYRITIRVHSHVVPGFPPKVYATGLSIRREDKRRRTLSPWKRVRFSGRRTAYKRKVQHDIRTGTYSVAPFTKSTLLDAREYITEAELIAKKLINKP